MKLSDGQRELVEDNIFHSDIKADPHSLNWYMQSCLVLDLFYPADKIMPARDLIQWNWIDTHEITQKEICLNRNTGLSRDKFFGRARNLFRKNSKKTMVSTMETEMDKATEIWIYTHDGEKVRMK